MTINSSLWYWVPLLLVGLIYWRCQNLRRPMVWGGSLAWPIILIKPLTSLGFFPLLTAAQLSGFFLPRAIFAFSVGAISAAIYESYMARHFARGKKSDRHHILFLSVGPVIFTLLFITFNLPFISSLLLAVLVNLAMTLLIRRDLIWDVAFSGLFFAILYGLIFVFAFNSIPGDVDHLWFTNSLSGLTLLGLPVEELATASLFGLLWGPLYVALKGLKERDDRAA